MSYYVNNDVIVYGWEGCSTVSEGTDLISFKLPISNQSLSEFFGGQGFLAGLNWITQKAFSKCYGKPPSSKQ